ncbi:fat-like cadherin-related tumor suppressor homolog isoform X4 [Apis mellifera]|uniref:Fat-like cadherin-related tumor suppressor homolog isoform X4 n=1 Tax=Apis mellifera TaxID=7460 RepID=A0A7M7L3D5_APIME|nr:fat-like cadherin-related tumor suppressor homolog isoform X4 [Apis mellifera]|eukprot:XP_026296983.1 fat-like cadherin-related tumor suppressor homolog isoform X4 [Apis mellifera]
MRRMKQRALLAWPWLWLWLLAATPGSPSSDASPSTTLSSSSSSSSSSAAVASTVTRSVSPTIIPTSTSSSYEGTNNHDDQRPTYPQQPDNEFRFTLPLYNVSIPENSIGKTYVVPSVDERMGIKLPSPDANLDIRFRIMSGDRDRFFKAEERTVGDFCFLLIRTRTGNVDVLNRERKDHYVLEVRATLNKNDGRNLVTILEADTTVVVTILDTNDLNPLFYPTKYEATVAEDTPMHRSILRVIAEDADLGRNGEIYYSFAEETDQFAVHPVSGIITLTRPLRYTERAIHELVVLAKDRGALFRGSSRASTAKVTIKVRQVNLHSPEIYVHHLPDIVEHSNADIYAIVRVIDNDEGVHGQIASLDIVGGDPAGHFRVRPAGGPHSGEYNIEVLHLLDRETAVQGYNLTLRATDRGVPQRFSYKFVPVHLADLNDNAPVFSREIYEVRVAETAPVNTPVIQLKVTDADEGRNALVFLEIVGGNEGGEFYVNAETGMLYTAVSLDAEKKAFYTLTVSAVDQGNAGTRKQSSAKVKINVVDTNDNDPTFEQSEMEVWIDENEPAGTSVVKITAKDRDSGENAYISYSIDNIQKVPFEIDHFSGIVKTKQVLDYETMKREYLLHVRVSDWGMPFRRQAEMRLHVKVRDVNDNRPQFERIDCSGHVPRYVSIGSEIITVSAIDFDAGNIISYRIVSGNEDGCFALDSASGVLSVACDLSDVKVAERVVNVTATDGSHFADVNPVQMHLVNAKRNLGSQGRILSDQSGAFECRDTGVARRLTEAIAAAERNNMPSKDDEYALTPSRYGENVHAPEFVDFPSEIKANESVGIGTTLVRIRARDKDLDYNGKLVFCVSAGDRDSVFKIDPDTGDLNVIGHLDRERESEYFLNISVYDLGKPQKSASRMLPVTILDVNDNAPRFDKSLASFRVSETALNGTNVWRANATDADLGENARVTYSLVTETNDFRVDPVTGVLTVFGRLDRERQEVYELRIRAQDNGGRGTDAPPLYSDALVRVMVDDVNDNAPSFALPSYTVKIREDVPVWTVVAVVDATDPDEGGGGDVEYFLSDAMESEGYFKVDKVSGTIRITQSLDFEERQMHTLTIVARDRGEPSLSSETMVIIDVVDVNENVHPPLFDDFVVSASVFENQAVGTLVTTVRAKDADPLGGDSRIGYTIRGGDGIGIFSIDNEGNIKTKAVLDVESKRGYWLTVYAQDHGVVPLSSSLQVYVEVLDKNDNTPLTEVPVYYPSVLENSPAGVSVLQIRAFDRDVSPQRFTFSITSGNPEGYFLINSTTGLITTSGRKLDRENQAEHVLEVTVRDDGWPSLSSTTRVVIAVADINDHGPEFEQKFYTVQIPASPSTDKPLFQVLAKDKDIGDNGKIQYSIKGGRGKGKFKIHPTTGMVYSQRGFEAGQEYEMMIRAADCGEPQRSHQTRVSVQVVEVPKESENPPVFKTNNQSVEVTESDKVGFLVALVQATDKDGDYLWYDIIDGDKRDEFFIGRDNGNVLLAKKLDWETQNFYNLTIRVTDSVESAVTQLLVNVIDINDHRPEFTESVYHVDISENVEKGERILELHASDEDEDKKVFYSLHAAQNQASLEIFHVDSVTGAVTLNEVLDRETIEEHVLTVMVKDQGTPAKRNYARVVVTVHDHNDHAPEFISEIIQGKVYETSPIGAAVVQVYAIDRDKGDNAKITYSITSGNVGNMFTIDPNLGVIRVARELDLSASSEYILLVKATDHGSPALANTVPVHVMVTMADNAPPRFIQKELSAEIYENQQVGTYVKHVEARSTSSLQFEIVRGNKDDTFFVNPSTGIIVIKNELDYEKTKFYNLTIAATNMASAKAHCNVIVHVLDRNDNAPRFLQAVYSGEISEGATIGSLVLTNTSTPLVIKAEDADSELNALLNYDIVEDLPRKYFHIDSSTGAIRTVMVLDHETVPKFTFHVKVSDLGKPKLSSETTAKVMILVTDVNDCPPKFLENDYNTTVLLPTYKNVAVVRVSAVDPDSSEGVPLRYDIIDGNKAHTFDIDSQTGVITVYNPERMKKSYLLRVRVSDGKYSSVCQVNVIVEKSENSGLMFQKDVYEGTIPENSTRITTVAVVNVLGSALNEHIVFSILNPTDMFVIGSTSGAIRTTGIRFDREVCDHYELIVEARSQMPGRERPRVAHVIVNVTILDINDNCPMFVNLPYYAVVSVEAQKGDIITKVHAIDMDSGDNGEVRYELKKGHGELFKVCRKTGEISLKQNLEGHNREYQLTIAAYDGGITPCSIEVPVNVKVIDRSMPVFDKQFYTDSVLESIEIHSPLALSIQAESPLNRKLIYSITKGNDFEEFALDFNTAPDSNNGPCVIYVVDELDYEQKKQYELTVRATDSVSGVYAEVLVSILVLDVNDCPPEFTQDSYNISVSEAAPFGTSVLRVSSRDNDTDINQQVRYAIQNDTENSTDLFHIDPEEGVIFLKRSLDHEAHESHHFTVIAIDRGVPSLSSTAHVWVTVIDMNDNPPKFEQPSYTCSLSEHAERGQFVTVVSASDPDYVDEKLTYTIVGGNEQQTYNIDQSTGIISLINMQNFGEKKLSMLNVSVTDNVYTSFARVKIEILPANRHNPKFPNPVVEVTVFENQLPGRLVTSVIATDDDFGEYGTVVYSIPSELMKEIFDINRLTGEIVTRKKLNREEQKLYEIPVMATDGGGRSGFVMVRVKVGDENDNSPVFLLREYKASIHGNLTINTSFLKVKAKDADEDDAARIVYSIYEPQTSEAKALFGINPNTGALFLQKSAISWENQLFELFIRAEDKGGATTHHADVPLSIYIMGPQDIPPLFERKEDKFFISEASPVGTPITRLKIVTNSTVTYRIVSGDEDSPYFMIDGYGQITLIKPLDRESKDNHLIGVLAETDSSPPLTALAEISLQVLDENDHAPKFESNPYGISVAENVEEGTSILKIIAHDDDLGSNGEVRYSFGSDIGELANVFTVDAYTGWISTLVQLDKEKQPEYKFQVVATDNGNPKHFARTSVHVKLKDYNDNPPAFVDDRYEATVNEDALPGTVVVKLITVDKDSDVNTPIEFYITSGDPRSQFQIRSTGEVYVAKSLDRETIDRYELEIVGTDGKYVFKTRVTVQILDVNDNPPYCLRYRYREILSEGSHPGTYVLTVLATDYDDEPNAKLRFYLTGDNNDKFSLDKETGVLKTIGQLDRETQAKYSLTAHVQDRDKPSWECSSQLEILISDLNDNAPKFTMQTYSATLPEDVEVGTLVTKVHATDDDIGINRKIRYEFIDSADGHFLIATDSGIVTLGKPLDRETKAMYNVTIQALDQGTPQLMSMTSLIVNVQDINDNPPEFASKIYFSKVPEIYAVGTEVARVLATSKDTGVNADVYYSIVGGNEHKKFQIDARTGVIIIAEQLDFERARDYFLTIQAVDGGIPPLSNHATVNITVIDSNDNAPIFSEVSYRASIREDAKIGEKVIQVFANDLDSEENGNVSYYIERGDRQKQFSIDQKTGQIIVAAPLDREEIGNYVLEVHARDSGIPVLSSFVMVNIEVLDANDNSPLFSLSNYTAVVQEDKPLGHTVLQFVVTDADIEPNAAPYTFDFRSGNEGDAFRLEQDGTLRTATKFNNRVKDKYVLHIRVFDNGSPPLYSDAWVLIKVIEESQYPPVITPLEVVINSYMDEYPGGIIGKVHATDQDQYDTLSYNLNPSSPIPNDLFQIDKIDGTLVALPRLDVGEYKVNVSVTDGKFSTHSIVKVNVDLITDKMLENSVIVRFREVSPENFILSHRKGFIKTVRNAMNCRLKDIVIVSVQPSTDEINLIKSRTIRQTVHNDLDLLFAVKKSSTPLGFYASESVREALNQRIEELEESTKLVVEEIVRFKCNKEYCVYGDCQDKVVLDVTQITPVATDVMSFVSPRHKHKMECSCKEGYAGNHCELVVNECARDPCPMFKVCIPDSSVQGYFCQCPEGFAGQTCDIDISKCHDESCYIPRNPISFSGKSYARYRIDKAHIRQTIEDRLSLSLRIRTVQLTGNLMYAAGKVDYNILEVMNGVVQYRFDLGSGEGLVRVSSVYVSDRQWHEIQLERESNSAKLTVDGKHVAHGSAPGINDILNLQSDDLYLGAEVRQHPSILGFEDVQRGFIGCMDDVRIARVSVPLHMSGASSVAVLKRFANVEFSCDAATVLVSPGICGSQPCQNGGTCKDSGGDNYECQCHTRFKGHACEIDTDPCASSPCLYGGRCKIVPEGGDFTCDCVGPSLSGKRCEFGRYCSPNPCVHGGVCEEGNNGPICKCQGFMGDRCETDINECDANPCTNGGTCVNEIGTYRCICPPNMTGLNCGNPAYSTPIISSHFNITWEQLMWIGIAVVLNVFLIVIFLTFRRIRMKRTRARANNINNETRKQIVLNSARPHEHEFKRSSKLSNLEVIQREPPQCPPRPASYTPSSNNEPVAYGNSAAVALNNLDTLRSYGSAGDELENFPPDYLRNLNRSTPVPPPSLTLANPVGGNATGSDTDSLHKPSWQEQMQLASFITDTTKIKNDLKRASPVVPELTTGGLLLNSSRRVPHGGGTSVASMTSIEDDPRIVGGYHWDCSDWVRPSQNPLPNITEVPGSEVPDSSSFHSNESNESNTHQLPSVHGSVDPARDIETLNEDQESEYVGDSECGTEFSEQYQCAETQRLNPLDSGGEGEYKYKGSESYLRHPNSYLPHYNIHTDTENETNPLNGRLSTLESDEEEDDVVPYGFPSTRRNRCHKGDEVDEIGSVITTLEERNSLLGGATSNSDLSTNLCEIDDSEYEITDQKSNGRLWLSGNGITQTSV